MLVLPNFYYINKNISSSNTKDRRLLSQFINSHSVTVAIPLWWFNITNFGVPFS